ncbi:hypothetical protein U9M48_029078 [Paspalum notatum var. saurae]|uniref:Uncharacterized protein n=1 Tax=Paspalum notatum var. saurae TaxID=547442 RepID=A0AAQ3TXZ0_PASNO
MHIDIANSLPLDSYDLGNIFGQCHILSYCVLLLWCSLSSS